MALAYPCAEITPTELAMTLARGEVALFDVRQPAEQTISTIPGATLVSPDMTPAAWQRRYGAMIAGRRVVFYCAVGARSARLAAPLSHLNLRGGIFRWAAEGRELVNRDGPTRQVHPYDEAWGRLLRRHNGAMSHQIGSRR